ncbi:MAG: HAMP domain-containing protein [Candidatus Omnitrophica bacterium]|nr:HAMP domain-containing protein [Candidatus Omnitrophota bacterium]
MEHKEGFRRTHFLVDKKFQFRFLGSVILLTILIMLLSATITYYILYSQMQRFLTTIPVDILFSVASVICLTSLTVLLILLPLVIVLGIFMSHKIIGPIMRMEKLLEEVGDGNFNINIKLRRGDELISLANAMNRMVDKLKSKQIKHEKGPEEK